MVGRWIPRGFPACQQTGFPNSVAVVPCGSGFRPTLPLPGPGGMARVNVASTVPSTTTGERPSDGQRPLTISRHAKRTPWPATSPAPTATLPRAAARHALILDGKQHLYRQHHPSRRRAQRRSNGFDLLPVRPPPGTTPRHAPRRQQSAPTTSDVPYPASGGNASAPPATVPGRPNAPGTSCFDAVTPTCH